MDGGSNLRHTLGITGIVDDIYESMGQGTRTMRVDAKDEARWGCPALPKDLGEIPDSMTTMTSRTFWTSKIEWKEDRRACRNMRKCGISEWCLAM